MSRVYRISVSESVRRHVQVEDGFQTQIELLAILPPRDMAELLAAELAGIDFIRDGDTMRRVDDDGVTIAIDLTTGTVTARLSTEADVDLSIERSATVAEEWQEQGRERLREQVAAELEAGVEARRREMTAELTRKLEQRLRDLGAELDRVGNRATAEALKARARQLGEIQEISENHETGELTIKVRV